MRTAREVIMEGNEGARFRDVIDNLDEDIILDCMEEYADYKVANLPKKIKTENLFENLEYAKFKIAEVFSDKYFDRDLDLHWIGEVLLIGDHYLQLDDIEFALKTEVEEESLLHFLMKPRKYNLENFWIGKVGRKNKKKAELKKCKENVKYAWEQLQEAIAQEHLEEIKTNKIDIFRERNIYNNLEDKD